MDLKSLYRDVILDHYKRPRNAVALGIPEREAKCKNPSCGDRITLQLAFDGEQISQVAFLGNGCAISQASASMMTEAIKGRSLPEVKGLVSAFRDMIIDESSEPDAVILGELITLRGIAKLHARVKCAMCGWSALEAAVHRGSGAEVDLEHDQSLPDAVPGSVG